MKALTALAVLVTLAIGITAPALAEISHVRIDTKQFEAGSLPIISVNVTTEHKDLSRLNFYLRQVYRGTIVLEKLEVISQQGDSLNLKGKEKIQDPKAALIVSEYRHSKWQQYKPVLIFDADNYDSSAAPVGIITMKPSVVSESSSSRYSAQSSTNKPTSRFTSQASVKPTGECVIQRMDHDTLWRIAANNKQQLGTNVFGAMLAIFEANPDAFTRGDITKLKADSHLICPPKAIVNQYQDASQDKLSYEKLSQGGTQSVPVETVATIEPEVKPESDYEPELEYGPELEADESVSTAATTASVTSAGVAEARAIEAAIVQEAAEDDTSEQLTAEQSTFDEPQPEQLNSAAERAEERALTLTEAESTYTANTDAADIDVALDIVTENTVTDELESEAQVVEAQMVQDDIVEAQQVESSIMSASAADCIIERTPEDTLWNLALKHREQWNVGMFASMLAIYEANPDGFSKQKIQKMRADVELNCPSEELLANLRDRDDNKARFEQLVAEQQ